MTDQTQDTASQEAGNEDANAENSAVDTSDNSNAEAGTETKEGEAETKQEDAAGEENPESKEDGKTEEKPEGKKEEEEEGKEEEEEKQQGDWAEDWREKIAGEDDKFLKQLKRYGSPKAVAEALREAQKKISSYKPSTELPENPKDEDIKKYREAYKIPEKAEDYDIKLGNGLVIGEADQPTVDSYLEAAHKRHAKPEEVKQTLQDYFEIQQTEQENLVNKVQEQKGDAEKELISEWGTEYRGNLNRVDGFLEKQFGKEAGEAISNSVLADGTILKFNPQVVRQFLAMANEVDPISSITTGSGGDQKSMDNRIAEIKTMMSNDRDKYYSSPAIQQEYKELTDAKERMKARNS